MVVQMLYTSVQRNDALFFGRGRQLTYSLEVYQSQPINPNFTHCLESKSNKN